MQCLKYDLNQIVFSMKAQKSLKVHLQQAKIETDLLQTGTRLASDSKIGVNWTMIYQCNQTTFYQSEASLKPVGSQLEASMKPVGWKFNFGVNGPLCMSNI